MIESITSSGRVFSGRYIGGFDWVSLAEAGATGEAGAPGAEAGKAIEQAAIDPDSVDLVEAPVDSEPVDQVKAQALRPASGWVGGHYGSQKHRSLLFGREKGNRVTGSGIVTVRLAVFPLVRE